MKDTKGATRSQQALKRLDEADAAPAVSTNNNNNNNNERLFDCNYQAQVVKAAPSSGHLSDESSGRASGSSSSDEDNFNSSASLDQDESLSGRSSAASSPDAKTTTRSSSSLAEVGANAVPTSGASRALMERVRVRLLERLPRNPRDDYEPLDLEAFERPIDSPQVATVSDWMSVRLIARYLKFDDLLAAAAPEDNEVERALGEAADKVHELLQFRARYKLEHARPDQFCKEIHQLNGIFPFGRDKNGLPVLYLRARVHRRWSPQLNEAFKRYVAWQVDLITKSNHQARLQAAAIEGRRDVKDGSFGIYFDCYNVSYACVDMDFLSYLVKILVHYYPTYCRYALCIDLPWLFRSVWKLVRSWLPEEAQSTVHLITSKQLIEFIDEDQVPNSMKINDTPAGKKSARGKHKMPPAGELKNVEEFAKELGMSSSEVKQFKSHTEKILKEYEQLGAV